jgi:hypothetical protein
MDPATVNQIFTAYRTYINTNKHLAATTTWQERFDTSSTWTTIPSAANFFNTSSCPTLHKHYRFTVVDNDLNKVEYDTASVFVDTAIVPAFSVSYLQDSTVYLMNNTQPNASHHKYQWNFGDGQSSTDKHPVHTFPAFDSSYRVCLKVFNTCSSYVQCDTVFVDSMGLIYYSLGKRGQTKVNDLSAPEAKTGNAIEEHSHSWKLYDNIPNPFSETTTIGYEVPETTSKAEITIVSVLGVKVKSIPITKTKGEITVSKRILNAGVYYYQLVIDGVIMESKKMIAD